MNEINRDRLFEIADALYSKIDKNGFSSLSKEQQVFISVWYFESEVNSGGFDSFYRYSDGGIATNIETALTTIGANRTANIVKSTYVLFGNGKPSADHDVREEALDKYDEAELTFLDEAFDSLLEYPDGSLEDKLIEYVESNMEKF